MEFSERDDFAVNFFAFVQELRVSASIGLVLLVCVSRFGKSDEKELILKEERFKATRNIKKN